MIFFNIAPKEVQDQSQDFYDRVFSELETAFGKYESGLVSIHEYEQIVRGLQNACVARRWPALRMADWSIVLRQFRQAERARYREAIEALSWCQAWARHQRGNEVSACLQASEPCVSDALDRMCGAPA